MAGGAPKIKFSPFEALLIGEKNKVVKRQPLRNTIYVTRLNKVRKSFNLKELFDVKSDAPRYKKKNLNKKTEKRKDLYCFEFEGRKLIVKGNEFVEFKLNSKKNENKKNCVKFKPDFKFKETLEEKIVSKIQNRRLRNKCVIPNLLDDRRNNKRKRLNAQNEKTLESQENGKPKSISKYLQRIYDKKQERCNNNNNINAVINNITIESESDDECKIVEVIDSPCSNNRVAKKFCDNNYSSPEIKLPPYPEHITPSHYDENECLTEILYEFNELFIDRSAEKLKVYIKKKSISTDIEVVYDSRLESKNKHQNGRKTVHVAMKSNRRNGFNSRIDEPLNIDDHLIEGTNLGTLFFNTSNGDDIFLGNFVRPLLFDSPFGSLPSV